MSILTEVLRDDHLTIAETAALLGVHVITARKWIGAGRLPSILVDNRRFVPKRAIVGHYAVLLANPATRHATIERLRAVATEAGVELDLESLLTGVEVESAPSLSNRSIAARA